MNLAARIALNKIHEAVERVTNLFGVNRDLGGGVLHLDSVERLLGRNCVILGDLEIQFPARAKIQPCEPARIELVGISSKRGDGLSGGIANWCIGEAWSLSERLRHGSKKGLMRNLGCARTTRFQSLV